MTTILLVVALLLVAIYGLGVLRGRARVREELAAKKEAESKLWRAARAQTLYPPSAKHMALPRRDVYRARLVTATQPTAPRARHDDTVDVLPMYAAAMLHVEQAAPAPEPYVSGGGGGGGDFGGGGASSSWEPACPAPSPSYSSPSPSYDSSSSCSSSSSSSDSGSSSSSSSD